ncbi:MAG TPA: fatty acyl-AMP ligase, partial [Micromonosporaceae bacterium]|nr:fatty acyl-AMP ligase [Micromonosporaceae bacterium]
METIAGLLRQHAQNRPADRAFLFVDEDSDGAPAWVSYAELDTAARRVAQALTARGVAGEPVLLLFPPGRAYVEGFLGCLYAGAVAVPAYPPDPARLARTVPRLRSLAGNCGATLALTVSWLAEAVAAGLGEAPELAAMDWVATDVLPEPADRAWVPPRLPAEAPALLQYTSGSTGEPKGVLLSHANLRHNAELVRTGFGTSTQSVGVSWLPPYHDMGLIGGILQPVYVGLPVVLMSPMTFLQRPMAWLEAVSRFGGTVSGGPNFAFDLCVRKSTPQQRADLDLSTWSVAFCGAEPVRAGTLDRFAAAFAPAGFRADAFYPCYGLAEGTLIVTGGRPAQAPRRVRHGDTVHVGCGRALGGQTVAIVDPETRTAPGLGTVGEIWVCGPSVATGYWNRPDETRHAFQAVRVDDPGRRYLRTGDLGFLDPSGELVVTGRVKDLVIVRGRNVYPHDLEHAVESQVAGVRPGCTAAFAVDLDGEERVGFAAEVAADGVAVADTIAAIRRVLSEVAEVSPATVVLLRPRRIPKTSSGKIQR